MSESCNPKVHLRWVLGVSHTLVHKDGGLKAGGKYACFQICCNYRNMLAAIFISQLRVLE